MGSIATPVVELDYTLRDLYAIDNGDVDDLVLVYALPSPHIALNSNLPQSTIFPIQGPRAQFISHDVAARNHLLIGPESYGFGTGAMPLVLFNIDTPETRTCPSYHDAATRVFDALRHDQRPQLRFVDAPEDIKPNGPRTQFVVLHPMDSLRHLPHAVDPYKHYSLQSKPGLAALGIPTPHTEIVETVLEPNQIGDRLLVAREVERMTDVVQQQELPFVLKLPQAFAGQGVFIVQTETERHHAVEVLRPELEKMILQIAETNRSLRPAALVVQEYLEAQCSESVNFFVTKSGKPLFLGVGQQRMSDKAQWSGNRILYWKQDNLRKKYASIMECAAYALAEQGYYGPAGIDTIETDDGHLYVVDLNPRVTGSYQLPQLKGHLYDRLGFSEAGLLFPLGLKCNRDQFQEAFADEFMAGRIVVCGWCESRGGPGGIFRFSLVSLVVAGTDEKDLEDLIDRINQYKINK